MLPTNPGILKRVPLNTFGIPFGLCGFASVWSTQSSGSFHAVAVVGWYLAAFALVALVLEHWRRGRKAKGTIWEQVLHPVQGPYGVLPFLVLMLLGVQLDVVLPRAGYVFSLSAMVLAFTYALVQIGRWIFWPLPIHSIHGGYLLPVAATPLLSAIALTHMGLEGLATLLFYLGLLGGAIMFILVVIRSFLEHKMPPPLSPTKTILVAPPALAIVLGMHYLPAAMPVFFAVLVIAVLLQVVWLRSYFLPHYSLGAWAFVFPTAAFSLAMLTLWDGYVPATVAVLTLITSVVGINIMLTVRMFVLGTKVYLASERELAQSDEDLKDD